MVGERLWRLFQSIVREETRLFHWRDVAAVCGHVDALYDARSQRRQAVGISDDVRA